MQRIMLAILLAGSMAGWAKAKEETGPVADQARKEILQIEHDKVAILLKGGAAMADWFERTNDDDLVYVGSRSGVQTKAQAEGDWRSGVRKSALNHQYDHRVRIYGNGTVAVVTYLADIATTTQAGGEFVKSHLVSTDVWIKRDGEWKRLVHHVSLLGPQ